MNVAFRRLTTIAAASAALLAAGCRRDEVTHYRVPKEPPPTFTRTAGSGEGGAMGGGAVNDVGAPPRPGGKLRWKLPKGWSESGSDASGMRYATLKPPVEGKVDVSVVVLPGPAGGELANVNRWRGQIGLPPVDEPTLAASRRAVKTAGAGTVNVYDFTSEGNVKSRVVAGLTEKEGSTWFVKMSGDAGPVAKAQPDFLRLLETLNFESR